MATILPGSPPTFNKADVSGTVKALCNYTRTLQENIDFTLGQLRKELTAAQVNLESLQATVSSMKTTISSLQDNISTLETNYNSLAARVTALEQ
jgi:peptidoglycan hydrolase CwlO-like protein